MTDRELMQMALEALDSDHPDIQLRAAIALRQALRAPKQWVGLTDEEIAQGLKESWVIETEQAWQSAVWWAEQKLKEKNT